MANDDNMTRSDGFRLLSRQVEYGVFYSGSWKTNTSMPRTAITATPLDEKILFQINNTALVDEDYLRFQIIRDGTVIEPPMGEGSSSFVQGKSIEIRQLNDGVNTYATWRALDQPVEALDVMNWSVIPKYQSEILLASFVEPTECVVTLGVKELGDVYAYMELLIDGIPVIQPRTSEPYQFLQRSSVILKGKQISTKVIRISNRQKEFFGSVKVRSKLNRGADSVFML